MFRHFQNLTNSSLIYDPLIHQFSNSDENPHNLRSYCADRQAKPGQIVTPIKVVAEVNILVSCIKGQMQSDHIMLNKYILQKVCQAQFTCRYCESCPQVQHSNINSELITKMKKHPNNA